MLEASGRIKISFNAGTYYKGSRYYDFQVLVGDSSRLLWVPCHGRFEVKSIGYNPVPVVGGDGKLGEVSDMFIARFTYLGDVYSTYLWEGQNGT